MWMLDIRRKKSDDRGQITDERPLAARLLLLARSQKPVRNQKQEARDQKQSMGFGPDFYAPGC